MLVTGSGQASLLESIDCDYPGVFQPGNRVTAHDVTHGKPDPEPYLKGAAIAGVAPGECIVIENAPLGVRAGKAAGCLTIAVTTGPIPREEFEREGADMIFPSMEAFADFLEKEADRFVSASDGSRIIHTGSIADTLLGLISASRSDRVFMLTDSNVASAFGEVISRIPGISGIREVAPGEQTKSIESAAGIWEWLGASGATRNSLLINFGGGVVTDLGGFAAATFKRGIRFINVPTTLLAVADAAIGGKTGVDFMGLKNEVGVFAPSERVVVSPEVLGTLPESELRSGFAEIVKMALLCDRDVYETLLRDDALHDREILSRAMRFASAAKEEIVRLDPTEKGLRRILNLGHTAGHAYESYAAAQGTPISHGEAVAHGMLRALELSRDLEGFPAAMVAEYKEKILDRYYSPLPFGEEAAGELDALMARDKKNPKAGEIRFILLRSVGDPVERIIPI